MKAGECQFCVHLPSGTGCGHPSLEDELALHTPGSEALHGFQGVADALSRELLPLRVGYLHGAEEDADAETLGEDSPSAELRRETPEPQSPGPGIELLG